MMNRVILLITFLLLSTASNGQQQYTGLWEGKLNFGVETRMIFNITLDSANRLTATLDVPDQGIKNIKVSSATMVNDSIRLEVAEVNAKFIGKLVSDSLIRGKFVQHLSLTMDLKKIGKVVKNDKLQTPQPPYPYKSQEITYATPNGAITYGATITIPKGKGPHPAILLLTGSGQQTRDHEILGHKPFAVIADHLTRNGFIVLRVDDRGTGKTTGDVESATTADFAGDADVSLNYLRSRKEVDKKRIGLIGHSEGGMIAQILASRRNDIKFMILLAAPGIKVPDLMIEQNRAILKKSNYLDNYVEEYLKLYSAILKATIESDKTVLPQKITAAVDQWTATTPKNVVLAMTGIRDEESRKNFIDAFNATAGSAWFRYFLTYDPSTYLQKTKAAVLALNGDKDLQVIAASNLKGIENALKKSKAPFVEVLEVKGMNHLFQECKSCTVAEYGQLEQSFSPKVLDKIVDFLRKFR
jgi:uncharacterized protein